MPAAPRTAIAIAVRFTDPSRDEDARADVLAVRIRGVTTSTRGALAVAIDDAVEDALRARGAGPQGLGALRDDDANLSDKLFRARLVGARTLAVALPPLAPALLPGRVLGAEDSATLLFWARATCERPVELHLDPVDEDLRLHVTPLPLTEALALRHSPAPPTPVREPEAEVVAPARPQPPAPAAATATVDADAWRTPMLALTAARGPQPLAALERLFATAYLPLDSVLHASGVSSDPRAVHARDDFRDNFSRVYAEAFHAFAVTGKRPKMVLDAPDLAARLARQHSARTSQLLLVDGMRYDVGMLVKEELSRVLAAKAALTHEMVLWSALPTTTSRQLSTLGQGVSALEDAAPEEKEEPAIRGRTAQTIRRVKVGSRDVYKLDLCDTRVREARERALAQLSSVASEVVSAIAKHAATLAPRTLLFVFGDHGFTVGKDGSVSSGGASPEEVLVPAFAFLTGEAH